MNDGSFALIDDVYPAGGLVVRIFISTSAAYTSPCDSRLVGVYAVRSTNVQRATCSEVDLKGHAIYIPLSVMDESNLVEGWVLTPTHV